MGNELLATVKTESRGGKVTLDMLLEAAERYNRSEWVRQSGKPYFVGRRCNGDGTFTHFLDRQA